MYNCTSVDPCLPCYQQVQVGTCAPCSILPALRTQPYSTHPSTQHQHRTPHSDTTAAISSSMQGLSRSHRHLGDEGVDAAEVGRQLLRQHGGAVALHHALPCRRALGACLLTVPGHQPHKEEGVGVGAGGWVPYETRAAAAAAAGGRAPLLGGPDARERWPPQPSWPSSCTPPPPHPRARQAKRPTVHIKQVVLHKGQACRNAAVPSREECAAGPHV